MIRTDPVAFQLIAMQTIAEIESGKLKIPKEELKELKSRYDPEFLCYKPFVDYARTLPDYNSMFILDVQVKVIYKLIKTIFIERMTYFGHFGQFDQFWSISMNQLHTIMVR